MNLKLKLERLISEALERAGAPAGSTALVAQAAKPQFGHYQANGVMAAAKKLGADPRELAEKAIAAAGLGDLAEKVEVAGPGFINVTLKTEFLAGRLGEALADDHLDARPPAEAQTVVVDYSHPNLAKEMHVGHLRSTIIGDAIVRVLEFLGHKVIRQNHVGDWGTQFGMLTAYIDTPGVTAGQIPLGEGKLTIIDGYRIADMEDFYRKAKHLFDSDDAFAEKARQYVVKLQAGDEHIRNVWEFVREQSLEHCEAIYSRLGVLLEPRDVVGESFYNDQLPDVVTQLEKKGLLKESQGAQCVFLDEFKAKDGEILPILVQKGDGGYLYATTDLAAVRYRAQELKADRILYVVDARQTLHLKQVFAVARKAGLSPESCSLEHHAFGMMLGKDGRPFKTREGGTVKLMALLDEAEKRAAKIVQAKNPDLNDDHKSNVAHVVGIGAVKYADLSQNRTSDYVFSWDKMLSLEGNTAPYMQYAYARVRSIFRKGSEQAGAARGKIILGEPPERALALKLAQFPETIQSVADECLPNILCAYLYDLAGAFMSFYESCPVLKAKASTRASRLQLCDLTARTIQTGLDLLGIETLEQM